MELAEAIARDLPFDLQLNDEQSRYPLAWLWELKTGGIAFIFPGYRMSPGAESDVAHGTVEGEGPWIVTDQERENPDGSPLVVTLRPAREHPPERGTEEGALRYLFFWHDRLPKDSVIAGTRSPPDNRKTRA